MKLCRGVSLDSNQNPARIAPKVVAPSPNVAEPLARPSSNRPGMFSDKCGDKPAVPYNNAAAEVSWPCSPPLITRLLSSHGNGFILVHRHFIRRDRNHFDCRHTQAHVHNSHTSEGPAPKTWSSSRRWSFGGLMVSVCILLRVQ